MKLNLITFLLILSSFSLFSQEQDSIYSFSLEEAVDFALENNYSAVNARRDIASALKKKWETTARGLPQISADVDYTNQLKQPVQLLPGEFTGGEPGTYVPIVFGTQQQMRATATASQLIFDGSYIVALQAAKTFLEYSKNAAEKTGIEVRKNVINAYGNVLLARQSADIIEKNLQTLEQNLFETRKIYENGLTEQESVEQLQITLSQVQNQHQNAERMVEITEQLLKLALGIDLEEPIILEDELDDLAQENVDLALLNEVFMIENNVNYRIARNLTQQRELELKLEKSKALPTLSTFINYGTVGNSNEFTFLRNDQTWYQSSVWGVSLHIPIFSSFQRSAKTAQSKIALEQAQTQFEEAQQQIRLQLNTAQSDYVFAIENYENAQENLALAERIADKNQIKFTEGLASSFELRQAQTQLYSAQQNMLQAMLNIINAKAELESILNTPDTF